MAHVYALFHVLFFGLDGTWPMATPLPVTGAFAVLALVAVGAALTWVVVRGVRAWPLSGNGGSPAEVLRRCCTRTVVLPVRAPDTPGKPRPRAPGTVRAVV